MTLAAIMLAATLAGAGIQEPAYSEDDLYRMSQLIYGEAGNCSRVYELADSAAAESAKVGRHVGKQLVK